MSPPGMTLNMLIDAIVRQTTVLVAHLATTAGARATLSHIANEMFLSLTRELRAQGLGHKVIADMFGMLLRSYHKKVRRLEESTTERGRSLWEALLDFIQRHEEGISRADLLQRFRYDDEDVVRSVLKDLVDSGLIATWGKGPQAHYKLAPQAFAEVTDPEAARAGLESLLTVAAYRMGPITVEDLAEHLGASEEVLAEVLESLVARGRISEIRTGEARRYVAEQYLVPFEASAGWEAAVFDHFQAVVTTIIRRMQAVRSGAAPDDITGGSTYAFDLWPGHPMEAEVQGQLRRLRAEAGRLRAQVDEYNETAELPAGLTGEDRYRATLYVGQSVVKE